MVVVDGMRDGEEAAAVKKTTRQRTTNNEVNEEQWGWKVDRMGNGHTFDCFRIEQNAILYKQFTFGTTMMKMQQPAHQQLGQLALSPTLILPLLLHHSP